MQSQDYYSNFSRSIVVFGVLLTIGLVLGAFVLGYQTKNIGPGSSSVKVKGLAEETALAGRATPDWAQSDQPHKGHFTFSPTMVPI